MKTILGHRSWNEQEVLAFFDQGSFTMCSLPHYRYQRVQMVCANLKRCGLIEKAGRTETSINYVARPDYHQWRRDVAVGKAPSSLQKLFRVMNPPRLLKRRCHHCHEEFETLIFQQKFCSNRCKVEAKAVTRRVA